LNYIDIKTTVQAPKPQTETKEQTSSKTSQTNPAKQAGNQTATKTNSQQDKKTKENKQAAGTKDTKDSSIFQLLQRLMFSLVF
jgi:ABC-type Na+ efflux pump permease subunit